MLSQKPIQRWARLPGKALWILLGNCITIVLFQICHYIGRMDERKLRERGKVKVGGRREVEQEVKEEMFCAV